MYDTTFESFYFSVIVLNSAEENVARSAFLMRKYLCMRKALLATVPSAKFSTMTLNSKLSKVVSYIQDKEAWERIYVLLKIIFPYLRTLRIADSSKA